MSGGPIPTPTQYWVCVRLIRPIQLLNIGWAVRRTTAYTHRILGMRPPDLTIGPLNIGWDVRRTHPDTHLILGMCPPNPTYTVTEYWLGCQVDQCIHPPNIVYVSAEFDPSGH